MNMADFLEEGDMPPPQQEPVTMSIGGPRVAMLWRRALPLAALFRGSRR